MTDKQFLAGMWSKVDVLAAAEAELRAAEARSRQYRRRELVTTGLVALSVVAVLLAFIFLAGALSTAAYLVPVIAAGLVAAMYGDGRLFSANEFNHEEMYTHGLTGNYH